MTIKSKLYILFLIIKSISIYSYISIEEVMLAIEENNENLVKKFLEKKGNPNERYEEGNLDERYEEWYRYSLLEKALVERKLSITNLLLKHNAILTPDILYYAIWSHGGDKEDQLKIIDSLLEKGANVNFLFASANEDMKYNYLDEVSMPENFLQQAIDEPKIIHKLLNYGAIIDNNIIKWIFKYYEEMLDLLNQESVIKSLDLLLQQGADINIILRDILYYDIDKNDLEKIRLNLLKCVLDYNKKVNHNMDLKPYLYELIEKYNSLPFINNDYVQQVINFFIQNNPNNPNPEKILEYALKKSCNNISSILLQMGIKYPINNLVDASTQTEAL